MAKISTKVEYSHDFETQRVLHHAHSTANGFFRLNNFLVLPLDIKHKPLSAIYLPDLPYQQIPRFWSRVLTQVKEGHLPLEIDPNLFSQTKKLIEGKIPKPNIDHIMT